jgi:hypothetical protein
MKMAVFWDVALCSLAETYQCFRGAYCLHHHGNEDNGGSKHSSSLPDYMAQHPRRQMTLEQGFPTCVPRHFNVP